MRMIARERKLDSLGLLPQINHSLDHLFGWLDGEGLMFDGNSYGVSGDDFSSQFAFGPNHFAMSPGGNYVAGGAHLLSQSLAKSYEENNTPLVNEVKHVMPTGFSAQGRSL